MPPLATLAAEFPNDNAALHRGAIWVCEAVCAAPTPILPTVETAPIADEVDEEAAIEIVDELDPLPVVDDLAPAPSALANDDAFSTLVRTLVEVARAAGGQEAVARIPDALARDPAAEAWRAIIAGESEDLAACGAKTLDEWASELVANVLAAPSRADVLRRELRAKGVAAFGLVLDAA